MPFGGEKVGSSHSDRTTTRKLGRPRGCEEMDRGRAAGKNHARRIVDEPQLAPRKRAVGAAGSVGLHSSKRELGRISEWSPGSSLRSIQVHQLAAVLGIY